MGYSNTQSSWGWKHPILSLWVFLAEPALERGAGACVTGVRSVGARGGRWWVRVGMGWDMAFKKGSPLKRKLGEG